MTRSDRLLKGSILLVQAFRIANAVTVVAFAAVLVATLPGAAWVESLLLRKYHQTIDPGAVILFMHLTMLLSLPVSYAIERLLAALRAMLRTVQDGEPFVRTNAARVRTVGWMLLCVQLADLGMGVMTYVGHRLHVEVATWQPSFIGWIAVLIAFVLAQVFERGAAMRDELDGTV